MYIMYVVYVARESVCVWYCIIVGTIIRREIERDRAELRDDSLALAWC